METSDRKTAGFSFSGSNWWKCSVQEGKERIFVILCLKYQIIDMKLHGNNEVFIENTWLAGMSNENSSPVFKNSGVDQIIFIGSWSNDKSLNSVAMYEHERLNIDLYSQIRAVNQSLHYCSCGKLTFPEELLKFMH